MLKKTILSVGSYYATQPDGSRILTTVDKKKLDAYAETFGKMKAAGLATPAPFKHDWGAVPIPKDSSFTDSRNNGGFWQEMKVEGDDLVGVLDPGSSPDAAKIGDTIREVSPAILDKWMDGLGRVWDNVLTHVALVVKPVIPGQDNFTKLPAEAVAAMSASNVGARVLFSLSDKITPENVVKGLAEDDDKDNDGVDDDLEGSPPAKSSEDDQPGEDEADSFAIGTLIDLLSQPPFNVKLPDDTTPANLAKYLFIALTAVQSHDTANNVDEAPEGSVERSNDTVAMSFALDLRRNEYTRRIDALVESGSIARKAADSRLTPLVAGYSLAFAKDGKPVEQVIDSVLTTLESSAAEKVKTTSETPEKDKSAFGLGKGPQAFATERPKGSKSVKPPDEYTRGGNADVTQERAAEVAQMLADRENIGAPVRSTKTKTVSGSR